MRNVESTGAKMGNSSKFYTQKRCCDCGKDLERIPCDMEHHGQISHGFCVRCLLVFELSHKPDRIRLAPMTISKYNIADKTACISLY